MNLLKTINPENKTEFDTSDWSHRDTARAIVFDENNSIALLFVKKHNYYKLPGGGVESGENLQEALSRECMEEIGVEIQITREVGSIREFRSWELLVQTSYCFTAQTTSEKVAPHFTDDELKDGFEIVWVSSDEAIRLLSLGLTTDQEGQYIEQRELCFLNTALQKYK